MRYERSSTRNNEKGVINKTGRNNGDNGGTA